MDNIPAGFQLVDENDPSIPKGFSLLQEDEQGTASAVGETALNMITGGLAQIPAGLGGLATMDADIVKRINEALTYEPRGKKGKEYTEKTGKFLEEKVRQPLIKQAIETSQALPFELDSNQRELISTIGADAFLNFMPLDIAGRGLKGTKPKAKEPTGRLNKLDDLTKPKQESIPEGFTEVAPELDLFSPDQKKLGRSPYDAAEGRWVVDENGIPIKQALSEDVQNARTPEQMTMFEPDQFAPQDRFELQRKAEESRRAMDEADMMKMVEDEQLKQKQIDEAYAKRQEQARQMKLDEDAVRRDEILMKLQEDISTERVSKGQQRKANQRMAPRGQRGAIDVDAVKEMGELFKRGAARAVDVLESFKGAFTEMEFGMAKKSITNPKSLDTVVLMTPEEFHSLAAGRSPAELNADYTPRLHQSIREGLKSKNGLWKMPYLLVDNTGQVTAHEGRHRMDVFKEQGIGLIPVRLRKEAGKGWGETERPLTIIPQDFKNSPPAVKAVAAQAFPKTLHEGQVQLPRSQRGAMDINALGESLAGLKKALTKRKNILKDDKGNAVIVFRGNNHPEVGKKPNKNKAAFVSDNPYLSSAYARTEWGTPKGTVQPFVVRGDVKVIEFPVVNGKFDKFAFDERAKKLGKNEILIARNSYDYGPGVSNDVFGRESWSNDQYAYTDPSVLKPLYSETRGIKPELFSSTFERDQVTKLKQNIQEALNGHGKYAEYTDRGRIGEVERLTEKLEKIENYIKLPKNQRGGIDINEIGKGVKKLVNKVTRKDIPVQETKTIPTKETAVASLPGNEKILKDFIPEDPTAESILTESLGAGDSDLKMTGVQAGATLTGIKYNSPLIRGIGRLYQNAQKRSEKLIRDAVYPVEYAFKKLNTKEIVELSQIMKMEMFDGREVTSAKLREAGYTDKQITAYQSLRDMFNKAYEVQAKALEAQNKKVPTKREAYMASRWNGDWHVPVYTKDGKLIYYVAEKTKASAHRALEYLKEQGLDLDLNKSKIEYKAGYSKRGDVYDAYQTMLKVIDSSDPRAQAVKSIMEEAMANDAFNTLGQKKHFESKANIRGFQGDRPWVTDKTNAYDLFKSQFDYAKNAFTWTELQKATKTSKEVLSNDYLIQEQPNNVNYAQQYAKNKLGFGEANWIKDMENAANKLLGTSKQSFYSAIGDMKSFFIISKLGFNTGFMVANMIQPVFTLPWHANLTSHGIPHNPLKTFINGGLDSISGYSKYAMGLDMPMSELGTQALKYAEDNGIVRRSMFDETANLGRHPVVEGAEKAGSATIQTVEHMARLNSFMGFVHHLEQSGMFPDRIKLFEKAEELTNAAMVDYRPGEGPMMFDSMGMTGEALKTLQTFKFNYYNQLHYFFKEAKEGRPSALLTFIALQGMLGGALGLPLMQEIDDIWSMIRDNLPNDQHIKVKDFGIKKELVENLPDWASYGGLSKLTGANFSSRFDSGNLMDFSLDSLFPFVKDIANQIDKVHQYVKEPGTSTGAEALYALAPPGPAQGLLETKSDAFKGPKTQEGNQVYLNLRDLRKQDANFVRTPEQEAYRAIGLTELNEAKYKGLRYTQNKMDKESDTRRRELADRFFDSIINKEDKTRDKIIYQYIKYDGDPQTLIDRLDSDALRRALPAETLQATKAQTITAIQKAKRMKELLGGFNK